ncbi:uncharacterized protein LOC132753865 [Ruditapes philippinarum]|uniref:uncharacterized protein LOC132753865 n=1 Tax=Ruditapes philippinarum TaxID=129788 RepID=UPI00295B32BC|nr:uncharacterized protein LOC132753865 [Ruditapes philippinarum]
MNICQSQAWGADFRADVMTYPKYNDDVKHSDLAGGDMRHLGNCQVCNREGHPWSVIVKLEGEPYDRESYQMKMKEEGDSTLELPPVEYYMGCFCHPRTKLFHNLYHFGHNIYHKCKELLEEYDDNDEKKIDKVATDPSLFKEMSSKLKKYMKEAEEDYLTADGERGNSKWTREYN